MLLHIPFKVSIPFKVRPRSVLSVDPRIALGLAFRSGPRIALGLTLGLVLGLA